MREIDPTELKQRLESKQDLEVLDIREADEYASWHIPGSRNAPVFDALKRGDTAGLQRAAEQLPRDRPIVAVCRGGVVSRRAAEVLESLGHDVLSLAGGIRGWGGVWSVARIPFSARPGATFVQIRRDGKGCLSYLFGADDQAAVVDPCVDPQAYIDTAERAGLRIIYVLDTHVHADHVSRSRALCEATGATLVMPRNDRVRFEYSALSDGDAISVGGIAVEVVATPGHTGESVCYLVGRQVLLTGDTLFVGRVGRPDLERGDAGARRGAELLFDSLRKLQRFDDMRFYPGHHSRPFALDATPVGSDLGQARASNELLAADREPFVQQVLERLTAKPGNYAAIVQVNEGRAGLEGVDLLDLEAGPNSCAAG